LAQIPDKKELVFQEIRVYTEMCKKWNLKKSERIVYFSGIIQKYLMSCELIYEEKEGNPIQLVAPLSSDIYGMNKRELKEFRKCTREQAETPESLENCFKYSSQDLLMTENFQTIPTLMHKIETESLQGAHDKCQNEADVAAIDLDSPMEENSNPGVWVRNC
jgi:hypothetical protein